jgi:hypothetical protein
VLDTAHVEAVGYGRGEIEAECLGRSSTSPVVRLPGMEHIDRRGAPKPVPVPFGRTSLVTTSDIDLWVTPNDSLSVEQFSSSGARATLNALPALAEALSDEAYQNLRNGLMTQLRSFMPDGPHSTYPDVRSFWGTPDGGGWADVSGELVRLSDSGVPVERLRRPQSRVLTATASHLVTVRPDDEWGAPLVEVWELRASPDLPAG